MVKFIYRDDIIKAQETPRITLPYFSKYEYTALLGERVDLLSKGAPPMVPIQGFNRDDPRFLFVFIGLAVLFVLSLMPVLSLVFASAK